VDERPVWRQLFDAWEKEAGPRLEEYVQTDEFAERMTAFQQMNRRMAEINEEATRQALRQWNLPTASDLEKVNQQLADIDRRLRALSQRLDQVAPVPGPGKRQGSKTPAGMKAALESRQAAAKPAEGATGGGGTVETEERPSAAEAVGGDTSAASEPTAVGDAGTSGVPSSPGEVTPPDAAGSADGAAARATASKAKARRATPAKPSKSAKSSAPAHKASQRAKSHSKAAGSKKASNGSGVGEVGVGPASGNRARRRGTERDAGNNPQGKA
jgi:hypothetical protein